VLFLPVILPAVYCVSMGKAQQKKEAAQAVIRYYRLLDEGRHLSAHQMFLPGYTLFSGDGGGLEQVSDEIAQTAHQTTHHLQSMDIRIIRHSAIVSYTLTASKASMTNDPLKVERSVVTAVLECKDEQWKFVHQHHTGLP